MRTFKKWLGFVFAVAITIFSGGAYAMAEDVSLENRIEEIPEGGHGVQGTDNGGQWHEAEILIQP